MNPRQISVQQAFDRHAGVYDERFSRPVLGEAIRAEVWQIADLAFASARKLLDIGSGTGEDAIHYARLGKQVSAVDLSPGMMARLKTKAASIETLSKIECVVGDMTSYCPPEPSFDGLVSNFGALNCCGELSWLRELARRGLRPGSRVVLTTMGHIYPLETVVFLLKGDPRRAFRRLKKPCEVTIEGATVPVYYHSLGSMRRMFGPSFRLERVVGLRAFLPIPGWEHLQRYTSSAALGYLDRAWCTFGSTASFADHFVSVWRFEP